MSTMSLSCPTCGAALDGNDTDSPTLKCNFCGTTVKNPFYGQSKSEHVMMPVINVNIAQTAPPVQSFQPQVAYGAPSVPRESTKNWRVTLFLCLFFGWIGIHRFYTGHFWIGVFQLLTLGGFGIWTVIDLLLIVSGVYTDKQGLPLSGKRFSKKVMLAAVGLVVLSCIALVAIGNNASKVDLPADHGWITGIERCVDSNSYGQLVLPENINIWQGWGENRGKAIGTVAHDTPVTVLEARRDIGEDVIYYKIRTQSGLTGWITENVIQFQPVSEGIVPQEGC